MHFTLPFGTLFSKCVFSVRLNYKFGSESEDSFSKYIEKFLKFRFGPQAKFEVQWQHSVYIHVHINLLHTCNSVTTHKDTHAHTPTLT